MRAFKITEKFGIESTLTAVSELVRAGFASGPVEILVQRPDKTRNQERMYHAQIRDIARTVDLNGARFDEKIWKALLVQEFQEEMERQGTPLKHPGRVVPALSGRSAVTVRPSSKEFLVGEASEFIEFLFSWGAEHEARFSDPTMRAYEEMMERSA